MLRIGFYILLLIAFSFANSAKFALISQESENDLYRELEKYIENNYRGIRCNFTPDNRQCFTQGLGSVASMLPNKGLESRLRGVNDMIAAV